ncbi:ABC transporter ATP-binding protein [Reichenbachiella agarivorans]|uniref:ABC transporter ATP-binding protein n=1 Tax=Reichenbachiella agarivorans TaxID=2979464 RepID=A0ABY6CTV9_9BACT|nr:ABC transporter ATP-binding protein [Reichenbachiella agarivorans]UXP33946.1 ABC transporter ATP-binding protein [Reichenbachiella agarivorans]
MSTLVQVSQVSKSFLDNPVIKGVSFSVEEGEIICILGESGSGKSTLLRMIGGLEDADEGSIVVEEEEITGPAHNLVPGFDFINFVSQSFRLEPFRTVWDNISSVISYLPDQERETKVNDLLVLCKLTDKSKAYPRELSGGQQQRVAIAMALADDPFLLLMDEPFSNLDVNMKTQIREEIVEILRKAEVTVILVSHDPIDAMSIADRVIILESGQISQIDTPQVLYENPSSPYAAKFLGPMNYLKVGKETLGIRPEKLRITPNGQFAGTVIKSIFMGMHYHVSVDCAASDRVILLYSSCSYPIGDSIQFEHV